MRKHWVEEWRCRNFGCALVGERSLQSVGIIGSGFIGRSWAVAFARAGHAVRMWDPVEGAAQAAREYVLEMLPDMAASDLLMGRSADEVAGAIQPVSSMEDAVAGASHIQENAPERLELKVELWRTLDRLAAPGTIIASSTSALLPSAFTQGLAGGGRCVVAHPVNPPHLIPLVEIVPAPWTSADTVARTEALMRQLGQSPVIVKREIDGFLLNRLQAAVLEEAFRLVEGGYADAAAVDACMRDGLAMRWVFMGPFETIDLNAPGGVRDYVERYQGMFRRMTDTMRTSPDWVGPALDGIEADRRASLPAAQLRDRQMWRDRKLMAVAGMRRDLLADKNESEKS